MPWATTREAPPHDWDFTHANGYDMHAEEAESCEDVARILADADRVGPMLTGRRVIEIGSGRGACLRYAVHALGAVACHGLDPSPGAVAATNRTIESLGGKAGLLGDPEAEAEALAFGADLAWSHGVVEHVEGDAIDRHVADLIRFSTRWVALAAPNPRSPIYAAWRRHLLDAERWVWGFEEPLDGYADRFAAAGCSVIFDGTTASSPASLSPFLRTLSVVPGWERAPDEPGLYTLVVARVPVTGGA